MQVCRARTVHFLSAMPRPWQYVTLGVLTVQLASIWQWNHIQCRNIYLSICLTPLARQGDGDISWHLLWSWHKCHSEWQRGFSHWVNTHSHRGYNRIGSGSGVIRDGMRVWCTVFRSGPLISHDPGKWTSRNAVRVGRVCNFGRPGDRFLEPLLSCNRTRSPHP